MNTDGNEQAKSAIDYYLDRSPYGEGAILVTGPWGSGKTRTVRAYMKARDERQLAFEPLGDKHVYVSLYGASSIDVILERIFAARHPRLGAGPVKFVADIIGRLANFASRNAAVAKTDGAAVRRYLLNLKNATLVVDDLERVEMPVGEVMGYLNTFVEHEQVKLILIAHEEKINWPEFASQKEKLISKTVTVAGLPAPAYDYFVSRMRNKVAQKIAINNRHSALETFKNTNTPNLRSLRAALDDFDRLVEAASNDLKSSEEALGSVLRLMIAMWTHIRSGTISAAAFSNPSELVYESFLKARFDGKDGADGPVSTALKRHTDLTWMDPVVPISLLADMAVSGRLDILALNEAAGRHSLLLGFQKAQAWIRLWRWPELTIEDYSQAEHDLRADLAEGAITDPGIILHVFGTAIDIGTRGGDPLMGDPNIVMREYIERVFAEGRLQTFSDRHERFETATGYGGFGFAAIGHADFQQFRTELNSMQLEVLERSRSKQSSTLLARLKGGDFRSLFEPGDDNFYMTPILHHIPVTAFADVILVDGVMPRGAINALRQRYSGFSTTEHPLAVERDWILQLFAEVRSRAAQLQQPQSSLILEKVTRIEGALKTDLGIA